MLTYPDITVVLGSKNRKNLLKATIDSIRNNGFAGKLEIIVVDGGSTDGTCNWLAKQKDILTIVQPNYRIIDREGISVLVHPWGEFMNIGFKQAKAPWILMVSDDLLLEKGAIQKGYDELIRRTQNNEKIGGGAIFFREYPRSTSYRIGYLPKDLININHGFYNKKALEDVNFLDEINFNFYCADGDVVMRFDERGWKVIALEKCFADHLVHKPKPGMVKHSPATIRDIKTFEVKYLFLQSKHSISMNYKTSTSKSPFWRTAFKNCVLGMLLRYYDRYMVPNHKQ